jgi:hypothetical protein
MTANWQEQIFKNVCGVLEDAARATDGLEFGEFEWMVLKIAAKEVATTLLLDSRMKILGPLTRSQIDV